MGKKIGLGIVFLYFMWGGITHFVNPEMFVKIMPPYLPLHYEAVYVSCWCSFGGLPETPSPLRKSFQPEKFRLRGKRPQQVPWNSALTRR